MTKRCLVIAVTITILYGCAATKNATPLMPPDIKALLADSALLNAHTGVYVYNPATGTALYSYQSDKYFVPASNTKLFSCYAGMKYLGDSLVGLRYALADDTVHIVGTGDPTLNHSDFTHSPVWKFLIESKRILSVGTDNWKEEKFGKGWAWGDYMETYMVERSPIPINGNMLHAKFSNYDVAYRHWSKDSFPFYNFETDLGILQNSDVHYTISDKQKGVEIERSFESNNFNVSFPDKRMVLDKNFPFVTNVAEAFVQVLRGSNLRVTTNPKSEIINRKFIAIYSQPTDSLLKPMMHNSDNFFAEQTLLMVSNEKLGYMNDRAIIDTLLKTDLKDLPQKPVWVDGSGLSRYNLFTPQTFVKLLQKMKDEFGMERMKNILPTGGEGTLGSLYKPIANQIFAKTGTLSGQVALSGYLYTKSNTLLMFSVLVNNHNNTAANVRKAVEKFVLDVWKNN